MIILNKTNGLLTIEEEMDLNRQFVKDHYCPFDEDPLTYEHEKDTFPIKQQVL